MNATTPRPGSAGLVMSAAQERLWFLHRMDPGDASYNMYIVWRLRGELDVESLDEAITTAVARHEVLRTRYQVGEDGPVPVVDPASAFVLDRRGVSEDGDPEQAARALVASQANAPFDLTAELPLRGQLIRLAPADHVLCLILHHIAGDGWSLNLLAEEVRRLYLGEKPAAPSLQFSDVAAALRERRHPDYWPDRLAGAPPVELPCDRRPAPGDDLGAGGFHVVRLSPRTVARLTSAAGRSRTTVYMALVAMYQTLLAVHSGQTDVVVGGVLAGRDRPEWEPVIGYLASTVVLRGDLSGDPTVAELLVATRRSLLGAMEHPEVPFETLPDRTLQTLVILHSQDVGSLGRSDDFGGLDCRDFPAGFARAKFDLMLEAVPETDGGLLLVLGHRTALFEPATIVRLGERLSLLAEEFGDPSRRLSELRTLTADDVRTVTAWEDGPVLTDAEPGAEVAPDSTSAAVVCGATSVGYAELDLQVDRLAARLAGIGAGPGTVVGVRIPRSVGMIVAVLAVRRVGAAYLPLAVDDPEDHVRRLVADSAAVLVLTSADPDDVDPVAGLEPDAAPAADPDDPACVLYTSGSTGVPKGVVVTSRNLAARVQWMRAEYGLGPGDRVVQLAPLTFDAHVEEIYPTLAAGATLVLLPDGPLALPELLASPRGAGITVLDLPTAYWHQLVAMIDDVAWPPTLRLVILGGEQAHGPAVAAWHARFGDAVRLVNTYGPTETTVIATACDLRADDEAAHARPPIGRPIAGTRVRVLDPAGRRVPPGAVGELCIGGAGVTRGYLNLPEQTAQRFVADPHGPAGSRLYRTGDRARWRPDGRLEFLGRSDDQIKVRGIRVEPGEIEAALLRCPGVLQACVAVRDEALVGYLVAAHVLDTKDVRRRLASELPARLVPSAWMQLAALPLTAAGKVNRDALPAPRSSTDAEHQPPAGDAEQLVASVWSEVLRLDTIDRRDDFFALGGHSLSAMRVAARLTALVEVDVPVRLVFDRRTLAAQATAVEALLIEELDALCGAADDLVETEAS